MYLQLFNTFHDNNYNTYMAFRDGILHISPRRFWRDLKFGGSPAASSIDRPTDCRRLHQVNGHVG